MQILGTHHKGPPAIPPGLSTRALRLRAFVLLAGAVRANSLSACTGRSVLDLPVADSVRLSDVWLQRIRSLLEHVELDAPAGPPVTILAGTSLPLPSLDPRRAELEVRVRRDASDFRGTAGVLRDMCHQYDDNDYVLVGSASQCPDEGHLQCLVDEADSWDGVSLSTGAGATPTGLMLIRCGVLRDVPAVGYMDLKEQALPRIAERNLVRVIHSEMPASPPIRSVRTYVDAVRSWHRSGRLTGVRCVRPFEERWQPVFSVVEDGAEVGLGASLHDSIVLAGGKVESGAQVVRSVVGPGGVVKRRRRVLGELRVDPKVGAPRVQIGAAREPN